MTISPATLQPLERRAEPAGAPRPDAPGPPEAARADGQRARSILVAVGESPSRSAAIAAAAELAAREGSRVTVVATVIPPPPTVWLSPCLPGDPSAWAVEACQSRLRGAAARFPATVPVTTLLRWGSVAAAVEAEIGTGRYDVVIVGAPARRRPWRRGAVLLRALLRQRSVRLVVAGAVR